MIYCFDIDGVLCTNTEGEYEGAEPYPEARVLGLRLNPHWLGLATMAFAHASCVDTKTDYADLASRYYNVALEGPPVHDERSRQEASGLPWSLSEYAYLSLTAVVAAEQFHLAEAMDAARYACDILIKRQAPSGHFASEHYEAPSGSHLADLIYTQNWATLGLFHCAQWFRSADYRGAFERSLSFLGTIQDASPHPRFGGCWRGLYDTRTGTWSGGDHYEGGQGSIYSGWTNAPIALAFLFALTGRSLFPRDVSRGVLATKRDPCESG